MAETQGREMEMVMALPPVVVAHAAHLNLGAIGALVLALWVLTWTNEAGVAAGVAPRTVPL